MRSYHAMLRICCRCLFYSHRCFLLVCFGCLNALKERILKMYTAKNIHIIRKTGYYYPDKFSNDEAGGDLFSIDREYGCVFRIHKTGRSFIGKLNGRKPKQAIADILNKEYSDLCAKYCHPLCCIGRESE